MLKNVVESKYGKLTNEEFMYGMDKFAEKNNGRYLNRDYKPYELNELTTYIDEFRRFSKSVGRHDLIMMYVCKECGEEFSVNRDGSFECNTCGFMGNTNQFMAVEKFLDKLEALADETGDSWIISAVTSFIGEICNEKRHCEQCFGRITEYVMDGGNVEACHCKERRLN